MSEGPSAGALYRFRDQSQSIGVVALTFIPPGGQYWLVERIAVRATGTDIADEVSPIFVPVQSSLIIDFAATGVSVYVGAIADQNLVDFTAAVVGAAAVPCAATIQGLSYPG